MPTKNKVRFIHKLSEWMEDQACFRNCLNCDHWQAETEICGKWQRRPPALIIATGCPDHSDLIPF